MHSHTQHGNERNKDINEFITKILPDTIVSNKPICK